jgi:mRNA-degrading endonuclease RelE of RelBE toxin-antitoxin system
LAPAAARALRKLPTEARRRVGDALEREAARAGHAGRARRGGKSVKALRGRGDRFIRLRVGDLRVIYDLIADERVLLVLGVVHRRDLERWLRGQ